MDPKDQIHVPRLGDNPVLRLSLPFIAVSNIHFILYICIVYGLSPSLESGYFVGRSPVSFFVAWSQNYIYGIPSATDGFSGPDEQLLHLSYPQFLMQHITASRKARKPKRCGGGGT